MSANSATLIDDAFDAVAARHNSTSATLHVLGASHEQLSEDALRGISLTPVQARSIAKSLGTLGIPAVVLATCHRLEVYWWGTLADEGVIQRVMQMVGDIDTGLLSAPRSGEDAMRQLIAVAGGVRSLRRGEPEILGQVRAAWLSARIDGSSCAQLDAHMQAAIAAARHVRRVFAAAPAPTIGEATAALIARELGAIRTDDAPAQVLLVGSGAVGRSVAQAVSSRRDERDVLLQISNRTRARAESLAAATAATVLEWDAWPDALPHADVVVFSARSPRPLVTSQTAQQLASANEKRALWIDLASPRNVEAGIELPGVQLRCLHELGAVDVDSTEIDRAAEQALERELERFLTATRRRERFERFTETRLSAPMSR